MHIKIGYIVFCYSLPVSSFKNFLGSGSGGRSTSLKVHTKQDPIPTKHENILTIINYVLSQSVWLPLLELNIDMSSVSNSVSVPITDCISLIYARNNNGPSADPCGTP